MQSRGAQILGILLFIGLNTNLSRAQIELPASRQLIIEVEKHIDKFDLSEICSGADAGWIQEIEKIEPVFISDKAPLKGYFIVQFRSERACKLAVVPLRECLAVRSVEPVPVYEHFYTPNDLRTSQWYLRKIGATQAWDRVTGTSAIVLAVVDDAVYTDHEDLKPVLWQNTGEIEGNGIDDDGNGYIDDRMGWDAYGANGDPRPDSVLRINGKQYHGTHVAGIAAAATDNNLGIASVSFNVSLMPIKASYSSGGQARLSTLALMRGIEYAIVNRARVINMSWGGKSKSSAMQAVLRVAHDSGIVLVAAAGNDGTNSMATWASYPAAYDHVIAVGSTDSTDRKSNFSSYYAQVDVMAPGRDIYSCLAQNSSTYGYLNGTSMASPLVAGLCALMLSKNSLLKPDEVEQCLKSSCHDISSVNSSYLGGIGAGRINVQKALECFKSVIARFEVESGQICPGETVRFINSSFGRGLSYSWSFPGGSPASSTAAQPAIKYSSSGIYTAQLIVTNGTEFDTLELKNVVRVSEPMASIVSYPDTLYRGQDGYIAIKLEGRAPFEFAISYPDGVDTLRGIGTSYFYYPIRPEKSASYKLMYVKDAGCIGKASGTATVEVVDFQWRSSVSLSCINVVRHQKISQTEGNFKGSLHDNNVFGHEMTELGDLDGDGVQDIAVGAVWDNDGGTRTGAVYILFMNGDGTVRAHQKISEKEGGLKADLATDGRFGAGVECIGDLDNDGVQDLITGSVFDNDGGSSNGALYVLFLKKDGTVKGYQKISELAGNFKSDLDTKDNFGQRMVFMGDVNSDGYPEVAVSSPRDDDGGTDQGAIYILSLDSKGIVRKESKISDTKGNFTATLDNVDLFGEGLICPGDIDGDGITDLITSAALDDDGGTDRGAVYVLFLKGDLSVKSYLKISSTTGGLPANALNNSDQFGIAMAYLGDVNEDGLIDIAVGAIGDDDGGADKGAVHLISVNRNGTVADWHKISQRSGGFRGKVDSGDNFGWGLCVADLDMNGDPELFVGAELDDDGGTNRGAVWMLDLKSTCESSCLNFGLNEVLSATQGNFNATFDGSDRFGCSISPAGDWDGNGYTDFLVGAKHRDEGGIKRGAVYLLFMGEADSVIDFKVFSGTNSSFGFNIDDYDDFGNAVSIIGDLDKDGIPEIAVGTAADDDGGFGKGAVYILYPDKSGNLRKTSKISSSYGGLGSLPSDARFGTSVCGIGDVDKDGIPDIAVGAAEYNNVGAVLILTLKADGSVKNRSLLSHQTGGFPALDNEDFFGCSVATCGDVDGNGISDLLIGAKRDDDGAVNAGAIYLVLLNSSLTARKVTKVSNNSPNFTNVWEQDGLSAENLSVKSNSGGVVQAFSSQAYRELNDYGGVYALSFDTNGVVRDYQILDRNHADLKGNISAQDRFGGGIAFTSTGINSGRLIVGADFTDHGGTDNGAVYFFQVKDTCFIEPERCEYVGQIKHSEPCISDSLVFSYTGTGAPDETVYDVNWSFGDGRRANGLGPIKHQFPGPGIYSVVAEFYILKKETLCRDTAVLNLTLYDTLVLQLADSDSVCKGESAMPDLNLFSCAQNSDSILWTPHLEISGETTRNPTITPTRSRWYYVNVWASSGLRQSDSIFIFVDTTCCPSNTRISASENEICAGQSAQFRDSSDFFGTPRFIWSFGADAVPATYTGTNPGSIRFPKSGLYKIRLIKDDDCGLDTAYHELIVSDPPSFPPFIDTSLCKGDSLHIKLPQLPVGQYIDWSPRGMFGDTLSRSLIYVANAEQDFVFTVTDVFSNCASRDTLEVRLLIPLSKLLGADTFFCATSSLNLVVLDTTLKGYRWSTGSTGNHITVNSGGTYWVEHKSPCLVRDTVIVEVRDLPQVELGEDIEVCDSAAVLLDNQLHDSTLFYLWSTGQTSDFITVSSSGNYTVEVRKAGCRATDSINVLFKESIPFSLGPDTSFCPDSRFTMDFSFLKADEYNWSDGTSGPQFFTGHEGKFWLKVLRDGCFASDTIVLRFKDCSCRVLYPSAFTPHRTDEVNDTYKPYLECPITESKLTIYNRHGVVVFSSDELYAKWDGMYKGEPALPGVYAVEYFYILNRGSFLERHFDYSKVLLMR